MLALIIIIIIIITLLSEDRETTRPVQLKEPKEPFKPCHWRRNLYLSDMKHTWNLSSAFNSSLAAHSKYTHTFTHKLGAVGWGVQCLAQGHLGSNLGSGLAPLQLPVHFHIVHIPYCVAGLELATLQSPSQVSTDWATATKEGTRPSVLFNWRVRTLEQPITFII